MGKRRFGERKEEGERGKGGKGGEGVGTTTWGKNSMEHGSKLGVGRLGDQYAPVLHLSIN